MPVFHSRISRKARFPLTYFAAAGEKFRHWKVWQKLNIFNNYREVEQIFSVATECKKNDFSVNFFSPAAAAK
jgi:hypothetical protein